MRLVGGDFRHSGVIGAIDRKVDNLPFRLLALPNKAEIAAS